MSALDWLIVAGAAAAVLAVLICLRRARCLEDPAPPGFWGDDE